MICACRQSRACPATSRRRQALQAGAVDDQMEIVSAAMGFGVYLQLPHPAAQGRMIGHGKIEPEPVHD